MNGENRRLSSDVASQVPTGEAGRIGQDSEGDSWHPVRLSPDGHSGKLSNQITWFLFVSLRLLAMLF